MFTGLIEEVGKIGAITQRGKARILTVRSTKLINEIKIGDSVAVNGVCLTVFKKLADCFKVEAVEETIKKTTLGSLKTGDFVNLELPLKLNERLGGHIVLGHVDSTGTIKSIKKT